MDKNRKNLVERGREGKKKKDRKKKRRGRRGREKKEKRKFYLGKSAQNPAHKPVTLLTSNDVLSPAAFPILGGVAVPFYYSP